MRKRFLVLGLMMTLAFSMCACGASDSGNSEQSEEKATEKVPESGEAEKDDAEEKIFWIEVSSPDEVNIFLKDEAVNGLTKDDSGSVADAISVEFSAGGENILSCNLSAGDISVFLPEGSYQKQETLQEHYADDTVRWTINERRIAETLRNCDYIVARYMNYADNSKTRQIFEYDDSVMIAELFGDMEGMTDDRGVKLGFNGNFVYISVTGKEYIDFIKSEVQELKFGTDNPQAGSTYSISLKMDEDNNITNAPEILNYLYESDGFMQDSGIGYRQDAIRIWDEGDDEHLSLWFYAPGFEEAVSGMDYCFTGSNGEGVFGGESGKVSDIVEEYAAFDTPIPEIPAELVVDAGAADAEYFTPLTPYYSITRYDYPEIPMTVDFAWYLVNYLGPSYAFMSMDTVPTSCTRLVLRSYNTDGTLVQHLEKCVYENEEAAIHTSVFRHNPLRTATGETYGTEKDFTEWIYEDYLKSCNGYLLLHDGNVDYYSGEAYAFAADDMWISGVEDVYSQPKTQSGSIPYTYAYGRGSSKIGESTCTYQSYCTFDLNRIKGK